MPESATPSIPVSTEREEAGPVLARALREPADLRFEVGLWLSGLASFLSSWRRIAKDTQKTGDAEANWIREFRLTYSSLILAADLNQELRRSLTAGRTFPQVSDASSLVTVSQCDALVLELRDLISLNRNFLRASTLKFDAWKAWSDLLARCIKESSAIRAFSADWGRDGLSHLPADLSHLLLQKGLSFSDKADLTEVLSRFAMIIRSLRVVGEMLKDDRPLKPTVLVFARVHEISQDLISFINNRLTRFQDESAELFSSLDGASYTASLELKKVYQQELTGIVDIRPAPSIHAKVETAYASLNDSFEQILAGFARLVDPNVVVTELFPGIESKTRQSIKLRKHLWAVLQAVKAAEAKPEKKLIEAVRSQLTSFVQEPISFLFFKDRETFERFMEEIFATADNNDLVPILHRFGAYLETLFGLVNMRTVLAEHPFTRE